MSRDEPSPVGTLDPAQLVPVASTFPRRGRPPTVTHSGSGERLGGGFSRSGSVWSPARPYTADTPRNRIADNCARLYRTAKHGSTAHYGGRSTKPGPSCGARHRPGSARRGLSRGRLPHARSACTRASCWGLRRLVRLGARDGPFGRSEAPQAGDDTDEGGALVGRARMLRRYGPAGQRSVPRGGPARALRTRVDAPRWRSRFEHEKARERPHPGPLALDQSTVL